MVQPGLGLRITKLGTNRRRKRGSRLERHLGWTKSVGYGDYILNEEYLKMMELENKEIEQLNNKGDN